MTLGSGGFRNKQGRFGRLEQVSVQCYYHHATLGKILTALGIALERDGHAGISEAVELLASKGWRKLVQGVTPEQMEQIAARAARRLPKLVTAAELVRKAKRFRDNGYVRE